MTYGEINRVYYSSHFKYAIYKPREVENPIKKQVRKHEFHYRMFKLPRLINSIFKMGFFNKLIFFVPNILSAFPSALIFSKASCQSIGTVTRKDTWEFNYYGRHVVFEMGEVMRINY